MTYTRALLAAIFVAGVTAGTAAPAFATGEEPAKCNSGRGNGSETAPDNDCDPGSSGGHNSGGD